MAKVVPEHQFGYLSLTCAITSAQILVKADKITGISHRQDTKDDFVSRIFTTHGAVDVKESFDEILDNLECIHPTLR